MANDAKKGESMNDDVKATVEFIQSHMTGTFSEEDLVREFRAATGRDPVSLSELFLHEAVKVHPQNHRENVREMTCEEFAHYVNTVADEVRLTEDLPEVEWNDETKRFVLFDTIFDEPLMSARP